VVVVVVLLLLLLLMAQGRSCSSRCSTAQRPAALG
jgi:hypothetical protein